MTLTMTDKGSSLAQIKEYLQVNAGIKFTAVSRKEKYKWINNILTKFRYVRLKSKKERGILKEYICRMTGMKPRQLKRLITKKIQNPTVPITLSSNWGKKNRFTTVYGPAEIILLAETDNLTYLNLVKMLFIHLYFSFLETAVNLIPALTCKYSL